MTWTNHRAIADRFSHIDAELVKATGTLSSEGRSAELVVRFYPWWEHPQYVAAVQRGDNWGFSSSCEDGKREVRVRAIEPLCFRFSPRREVIDWRFEEQHPLLWSFAERSTLYVNAPFDRRAFFDGLMALALPNVSEADLIHHIMLPTTTVAPLGMTLPAQLHESAVTVFGRLGVPVFSPATPELPRPAVVFLIDDDDYIVAADFEVDVPEFIHDPKWFQPAAEPR
jgi:hypothetical protein